jgi:RNA polymerase sigma-70 factor (ECF subfamily)
MDAGPEAVMHGPEARAGALSAFYDTDYPRIVAAIVRTGLDLATACEAVDEAIAGVWRDGGAASGQTTFAALVRARSAKIARRASIRRRLERRAGRRAGHGEGLRGEVVDNALAIDVRRVVGTLSPRQRQVVVRHYLLDMSVEDCAHELGISPSTVKTTLKRARTLLARRLNTAEDEA